MRLFTLIAVCITASAFTLDKAYERQLRDLKRTWANFEHASNAGALKVSPNIYMHKTEVSNIEFNAFLKENTTFKLDTQLWETQFDAKAMAIYYHSHPAYKDYPVVNISKRTAIAYCKWLKLKLEQQYPDLPIAEVRLPTEGEWLQFAQSDCSGVYPNLKGNSIFMANGKPIFNCKDTSAKKNNEDSAQDILAPVSSYYPSGIGVTNLGGNAAEMIVEDGFTKGGSWNDFPDALKITSKKPWNGEASPEVGLRPVLILK